MKNYFVFIEDVKLNCFGCIAECDTIGEARAKAEEKRAMGYNVEVCSMVIGDDGKRMYHTIEGA